MNNQNLKRIANGTFTEHDRGDPGVRIVRKYTLDDLNSSSASRNVIVADAMIAGWPGTENLSKQEQLTRVVSDLALWADWAENQERFGWTLRIDKTSLRVDIVMADLEAGRHFNAEQADANGPDAEEPYDDLTLYDIGSAADDGESEDIPTFTGRSRRSLKVQKRVKTAHAKLERWNLRQGICKPEDTAVLDALTDLKHWSHANDLDYEAAFTDALDELEKLTGR